MSDKEFFFAMSKQTIGMIVMFAVITLIIFLLGKLSWWLGVILFVIFCLICVISSLQSVFGSILGIFSSIFYFSCLIYANLSKNTEFKKETIGDGKTSDQTYIFLGSIVHLISALLLISFNFFLYTFFF